VGELLAQKHLLNKGYKFLTQNFYTNFGEIDLIFLDDDILVFVEVKTRSNPDSGHPEEAITPRKLSNLQKAAQIYLLKNPQYQESEIRIDAVAIDKLSHEIRHCKGVY
jgi:putative endonuclease